MVYGIIWLMKKLSRVALVRKLDTVFFRYIRERDKKCVVCGSTDRLTCGHLFSRIAHSTRWSELNCHAQCWPCNYKHEFDPYPMTSWFIKKFGQDTYDKIHLEYATPRKFKDFELEELIEKYAQNKNS